MKFFSFALQFSLLSLRRRRNQHCAGQAGQTGLGPSASSPGAQPGGQFALGHRFGDQRAAGFALRLGRRAPCAGRRLRLSGSGRIAQPAVLSPRLGGPSHG